MKKQLLLFLFAIVASVGTMFAWDYERVQIGDLYYNFDATNQTAEVTSQNSSYPYWSTTITTAIIPASVEYNSVTYSVTSIGQYAFSGCSGLTSVTIGNSVTSIGNNAFSDCNNMTSIDIPNSVARIGTNVFSNCSSLTSLTIPASVVQIDKFDGPSHQNIVVYGNNLTSLSVEAGNPVYDSRDNCNAIIETATNTLLMGCQNTIIPNTVTRINEAAFYNCANLIAITIPTSVASIGEGAFHGTGLTSVALPANSVLDDWYYSLAQDLGVFSSCNNLNNIALEEGLTSIAAGTFAYSPNFSSINIPASVTKINMYAFSNCTGLTEITCNAVNPPALGGLSYASSVYHPNDVFNEVNKSIPLYVPCASIEAYKAADGWSEFTNIQAINPDDCGPCLLASGTCGAQGDNLTWELSCDGVLTISGTGAMTDCSSSAPWYSSRSSITSVIISDGVTSIGGSAFSYCSSLTSVTIPNSVTTIGKFAFVNCTSLSSLTIPASVTQIEGHFVSQVSDSHYNLIMESNNITQLSVEEGNPVYDSRGNCNAIIETATNTLLVGCQNTVIPNTVTRIGYAAFYRCATLTSIDIPSSVTIIEAAAFGETGLTNIILPHNVTIECPSPYADYYFGAFGACRELTSVEFAYGEGGSVSIGNNTFSDCDKLNNITIPNNVTDIGNYAFLRCSGLNNIIIPGSVTSIGEGAFRGCTGLTSVTNYATTPQTIESNVFNNVDKSTCVLNVPKESVSQYQAAEGWKEFTNILPIGEMDIDHPTNPGTYQLTLNASIADAGVLTGAGMYAQGTEVSVSATANTGYTFERWSDGVTDASRTIILVKDSTLTAFFSINHYTVTFVDEDGTTVLASDEYEYGATPVAPADPTKAATAQYTYTFTGWSPEIVAVTGAATYKATYSQTVNKYTITFVDEDGTTVLASAEYEYGATPVAPADPTKAATAQYTYTFAGWSPEIVAVTGAATYTAIYSQTVNKYTVTFVDEDGTTVLASDEYEYGATPVAPADPTKAATAQYTYTFTGWSPEIVAVTGAATYTATYSQTVNKYTITFVDEDGTTVLASAEYEYGATPVAPADPTKAATEEYTYTFSGWDKTIAVVTEAATYTATYSSQLNNVAIDGDQDLADFPVGENTHITVGEDGNLTVSEPTTIGTITVTVNGDEASEITGVENLTVTNAEMILRLEPNKANATPNKWYAFGVPFEVEVSGGIYAQGSASPAIYNSAFVLDEYDGSLRASTQQGWKRVSSSAILQPGVLYMIAVGSTTNEWRFVKRASASLTEQTSLSVAAYPSAIGAHHAGWNGLANTLFRDASVALDGVQYITTYNNEQSVYEVQPIADATLAMAKPFFVQVPQAGTLHLTAQPAGVAARSLMAADELTPSCVLSLSSDNFSDRAYITAQVGKENTYSIGHDLMKMLDGTPSVPQLWLEGYNLRLAAYELALTSESTTVIIPMGLYAPQNGTYTLDVETQSDYYTLTLLADDTPVAELGEQTVSIELEQGNNSKYALCITKKTDVVTNIINGTADGTQVVKFVQDDLLYILRDGKTYTIQGVEVK